MPNKDVAKAIKVLRSDGTIETIAGFWTAFGRPDLSWAEDYGHLAGAPTLQSALYEAKRELDRRNLLRRGKSERPRTARPLTCFLHSAENYGDSEARYFERRATKGWRWERVSAYESEAYQGNGVRMLVDLPQPEIRKRRVA